MLLRLLYNEKLAQASYFVGCQACGEALVLDPSRDIDQYLKLADSEGMRITAVTETHIHADCLSGARELAARTGATLYLSDEGGEDWKYQYASAPGVKLVHDNDEFWVGNVRLQVMHTPGHTPEHISFILTDRAGADQPMGIFTGDFVFVGDVGRPDLLETAAGIQGTMEAGARQLYASLQRFQELPDYLQLWPGHGAGSACGKALGAVPQSTVGYEKMFNWALNTQDEAEFIATVLEGQPEPPFYFAMMKQLNKEGPAMTSELAYPERFAAAEIDTRLDAGMTIIDTRSNLAYGGGHIPGTLNIAHTKSYLTWFGWLVSYARPFALIVDEAVMEDTVDDLRLIGLDNVAGYWTPDVITAWAREERKLATIDQVTLNEVERIIANGEATILDVRGTAEYNEGHIPGAQSIPLGYISRRIDDIPADKPLVVHCQTGVRSSVAASVLEKLGRSDVHNYLGSFEEWASQNCPVETASKSAEPVPAAD